MISEPIDERGVSMSTEISGFSIFGMILLLRHVDVISCEMLRGWKVNKLFGLVSMSLVEIKCGKSFAAELTMLERSTDI